MSKLIKLFLLITLVLSTLPSRAMFLRAMHRLSTSVRPSVSLAQRATSRPVFSNLARTLQPTRFASTSPNRIQFTAQSQQHSRNYRFSRAAASLAGLSALAGALYVGSQLAHAEEKEKPKRDNYVPPFEEQRKKYYEDLKAKPWGKVAEKYIKELEEEEKKLMDEFFRLAEINEAEWLTILADNKEQLIKEAKEHIEKIKITTKVDEDLKKEIEDTLTDFKINPADIVIVPWNDWALPSMGIISNSLFVNQQHIDVYKESDSGVYYEFKTHEERQAYLRHEIQHFLHHDWLKGNCMKKYFDKMTNQTDKESLYFRHSCFAEKRADILACLSHPMYAEGLSNYFLRLANPAFIQRYYVIPLKILMYRMTVGLPHTSIFPHSSDEDRIAYLQQLRQEMLQAIEENEQST